MKVQVEKRCSCGKFLGYVYWDWYPGLEHAVTHGMCGECYLKYQEEIRRLRNEKH